MKRNLKSLALIALVSMMIPASLFAITGREVAEKVEDRESGDSSHSLVQMDLIDKDGGVSSRTIEEYSMDDADDNGRVMMVFHAPASVKNTRFLVMGQGEGKDDDKWIYLPAMQKVRRIASSEGGSSFMGSDFTYDDMSSLEIDEYTYELLGEESFDGVDCYMVEATPIDMADQQYSKIVTWVDKNTWVNRKVEMYDLKGDHLKTLTTERVEAVQGFQTPIVTRMANVQTGHSTLLTVKKFVYNENIPSSLFSSRFLQTGKP